MRAGILGGALLALLLSRAATAQTKRPANDGKPVFWGEAVLSATIPTSSGEEREAELFWAAVGAAIRKGSFGAEAEVRGRDGAFRPYFEGSVWLEKGAGWVETPAGTLRVGKVAGVLGLADRTFSGDLFSVNGRSRNPEWGAALAGSKRFGYDELSWSARWAGANDHVAWEEEGRDVESDDGAALRDAFEGRVDYVLNKGLVTIRPGVSAGTGRVVAADGSTRLRRSDVGADLRATVGPVTLEAEAFWRDGDAAAALAAGSAGAPRVGYDEGWAWRFGLDAEFPTVRYRYVYSEWRYTGTDGEERIHQPAVVWTPVRFLEASVEYSARRHRNLAGARTFNSIRLGLALRF